MNKLKLTLIILFLQTTLIAQPQWKFHIAFEDATGAKDTIWMIWDTTATYPGVDTALGEGGVNFNYTQFNVWIYNDNNDSTKTTALSWNDFPYNMAYVYAFNYQYPLIVRWDTALFHATFFPQQPTQLNVGRIDNDYFFLVNNSPVNHYLDMFLADTVYAPYFNWGSQSQFPMIFHLTFDPVGIEELSENNRMLVFPIPATETLNVCINERIKTIRILSCDLRRVIEIDAAYDNNNIFTLDITKLNPSIYFIEITNSKNQKYYEKFIKTDS